MKELRHFGLFACLIMLGGIALHRAIGAKAEPLTGLALYTAASAAWRARQRRLNEVRAAVIELRAYQRDDRHQLVEGIESPEIRTAVARELLREGSESHDGLTEVFPLPAAFRRRALLLYWRRWALSAAALLVAALLPDLAPSWRFAWLALGVALAYRAWRQMRSFPAVASVIEVNPFRIAYVRPDGIRLTIPFSERPSCEDMPEHKMFVVRSGEMVIPVSYHLMGFNRIAQLVETYGARIPEPGPPTS